MYVYTVLSAVLHNMGVFFIIRNQGRQTGLNLQYINQMASYSTCLRNTPVHLLTNQDTLLAQITRWMLSIMGERERSYGRERSAY